MSNILKKELESKKKKLTQYLERLDSLLIAFSGGVDSTFLLAVAYHILGEKVVAATAESIINPPEELKKAEKFTNDRGISHIIFRSREIEIPEFLSNSAERCYICKKAMGKKLMQIAKQRNIRYIAHAANMDDLNDYRPGSRAADELGLIAPLITAGIYKEEIRLLSKEMGLTVWNEPSMACLASRIHGDSARIEVEKSEIKNIFNLNMRDLIVDALREIGFKHISVDLEGYISGSMNRSLATD